MTNPLVSVIVPTKNSSKFLEACLASIKAQTYKNIELIVVDNFSTDDTQAIARKYTDKVFSQGPERSAQRNFGASKSSGEYVLFVDSDMELSEQVVESCLEEIRRNNTVGVIIPEESFGEGFWAQCKRLERSFYVGVSWMEAARFFKRKCFVSINGYNEKLISGEDWDLSQRAAKLGGLTRTTELIRHNEGKLSLSLTVQKKYYYASQFTLYRDANKNEPVLDNQTSVIKRYALFFSKPAVMFSHPVQFMGMLLLKTAEFAAGGAGLLFPEAAPQAAAPLSRFPTISFVLPTYNADRYLEKCLISIFKQQYPADKIEVLLIDGGSTDKTLEIARKFPVRILENPRRVAEYGKSIGINESKGEFFVLIDSDNEIVETNWLENMVRPILEHPELFGVESPLSYDETLSSLNRYFARMRIADPLARMLVSKPEHITQYGGYSILEYGPQAAIVTGANGFLWNKNLIMKYQEFWKDKFEEGNFGTYIHENTGANYAIPKNTSVRHFYTDNLSEFVFKRRKIAGKARKRMASGEYTWFKRVSGVQYVIAGVFLASGIGPVFQAAFYCVKNKSADFLWHPIISLYTIWVYAFSSLKSNE